MATTIYFDMDGTLADLYGVKDWLPQLRAESAAPYIMAKPLVNPIAFVKLCQKLKAKGFRLGIISWGSKKASATYLKAIAKAKRKWLKTHFKGISFDKVKVIPYGVPKTDYINRSNVNLLFDDDAKVRQAWSDVPLCYAYSEKEMLATLSLYAKL